MPPHARSGKSKETIAVITKDDHTSVMEIRWLRSFLAVAEEMHFSRAARRLSIAQPALTAQIQQLEESVGHRLFNRANRLHGLTPAGLALIPEARTIVERADGLRRLAGESATGESGFLRVGMIPPAATGTLADTFRELGCRRPGVRVEIRVGNQDRLMALLVAGELDLLVGRPEHPLSGSSLQELRLSDEEQGVVLRADDSLKAGNRIPLRELHGRILLLL